MEIRRTTVLVTLALLVLGWPASSTIEASAASLPLKLSDDGRRVVDQDGIPFLVNGDAPWSLLVELTKAEAEIYLEDRRAKGINLLMVNLIEHNFSSDPPNNRDGIGPFVIPADFSTPNEAYFEHADWVLQKAAEKGLVVLLAPAYPGYNAGDEGWWQEMLMNGPEVLRDYGRWVGERYRDFDNIVWLNGGDYSPPDQTIIHAIAEGILENDDRHLHSVHTSPNESAGATYAGAAWLDVGNTYYYHDDLYVYLLEDWNRVPFKPFVMLESHYESNWIDPPPSRLRRQAYWPMFTGAQGHIYGNFPMWYFGSGWEDALDSAGAQDMERFGEFFATIPWWKLLPDQDHELLTGNYGTFGGGSTDYVTAAASADGLFAAAYVPPTGSSSRTLVFDLTALNLETVRATWFDPTDGSRTADDDSPFDGTSTVVVVDTPGANSEGSNDWVLLLESAEGQNLGVDNLSLKLDFQDATLYDRARLQARPVGFAPAGDDPAGVLAAIDVAGAVENLTFDAKGRARNERVKATLKRSGDGVWSIKAVLKKGAWSAVWQAAGLLDQDLRREPVALDVSITLDTLPYAATVDVLYSARAGKVGKAKLDR